MARLHGRKLVDPPQSLRSTCLTRCNLVVGVVANVFKLQDNARVSHEFIQGAIPSEQVLGAKGLIFFLVCKKRNPFFLSARHTRLWTRRYQCDRASSFQRTTLLFTTFLNSLFVAANGR